MELEQFLHFDIVIYAEILLIIMLGIIYLQKDVKTFSINMFKLIIKTNLIMIVLELLSWSFEGVDGNVAWYLNYGFNSIVVLFTPVIACFWASYIDYKIFNSIERVKTRHYYLYPFYIGAILSIINLFHPVLFSINADNVYSREPFIWVNVITMYSLLIYTVIIAFKNRKVVNKNVFLGVSVFLFLPAIGSIFQMIYLGVLLIWPMFALAVVVAYIFLETVGNSRDYLTNLFTRAKTNEYANNLIAHQVKFSVIMIDLDDFKDLNDTYGHIAGDNVLRGFGIILMNVFNTDSLVSRFGGDEFIIITGENDERNLLAFKQEIYQELKNPIYLIEHLKDLKFSYGYSFFKTDENKTIDELVVEADNLMYEDKATNKNYKRRKSD